MPRHQYTIDDEIRALLPPLSEEEHSFLRSNMILSKHCDPLTVLKIEDERKQVLGDGHHREGIAAEHGIPFDTRLVTVPDRATALAWVIRHQLGRRNLTDERRAYYRGKEYLNERKAVGRPAEGKLSQSETINSGQAEGKDKFRQSDGINAGQAAEVVAERNGVSPRTIERDAAFAEAVDELPPKEKEAVLSGNSGQSKAAVAGGARPVLCGRCKRVGPVHDCPQCAEERKKKGIDAHGRKPKKKKPKPVPAEVKDALGNVVPDHLRDVFADAQLAEMVAELEGIQAQFRPEPMVEQAGKLCEHYGFILIDKFRDHLYDGLARVQLATEALSAGLVHAVCPKCGGVDSSKEGKTCRGCRGFGAVPQHRYEELTRA